MSKLLEEIKPIKVDGKEYMITLIRIDFEQLKEDVELGKGHFCAYVYLPKLKDEEDYDTLAYETYRNGIVVGVDTAHSHNMEMTLEEKKKDAYKQIKEIIKSYHKIMITKE